MSGDNKELVIKVIVGREGIASMVKRKNFPDNASGQLEIIGILENLLQIELRKVNMVGSVLTKK